LAYYLSRETGIVTQILTDTANHLIQNSKWFREHGVSTDALKRLLVLECRKNLALLDVLDLDGDQIPNDASGYLAVCRHLETGALEMLLADSTASSKLMAQLAKEKINIPDETDAEDVLNQANNTTKKEASTTDRLLRLYVRLTTVRTIASLWTKDDRQGYRHIAFATRLRNIKKVYVDIVRALPLK
jgi:hypothetical protein